MDLLDIILGKKLAAGTAATVLTQAQQAVQTANGASTTLNSLIGQVQETKTAADNAAASATAAAGTYDNLLAVVDESMLAEFSDLIAEVVVETVGDVGTAIETLDERVDTLEGGTVTATSIIDDNTSTEKVKKIRVTKNNANTDTVIVKQYTSTGQNEDGTMTQKAISDAIAAYTLEFNNSTDHLLKVNANGTITPSTLTETALLNLINNGSSNINIAHVRGVNIDYINKTISLTNDSVNASNLSSYQYRRCNVNSDGTITAFEGDSNFAIDGSNGNVMVYIPKFYYRRQVTQINGNSIEKESIWISDGPKEDFILHPAFYDSSNNIIDYILYSAYEGGLQNINNNTIDINGTSSAENASDTYKLVSYAGLIPTTNLTINTARIIAENNGNTTNGNWGITTIKTESMLQLAILIDQLTYDVQTKIGRGIVDFNYNSNTKSASFTGSTSSLISTSIAGQALSTINNDGISYSDNGKRSVYWRGIENLWGNVRRFVDEISINNNNKVLINNTNTNIGLPSGYGIINRLNYSSTYSWLFIPSETISGDTLISDNIFINNNQFSSTRVYMGGGWSFSDGAGILHYSCDKVESYTVHNTGARLQYIPKYNASNYEANIALWQSTL